MKGSITAGKWLKPVPILIFVLVWKVASLAVDSVILLPSPELTLQRLFALAGTEIFWLSVWATVRRTITGFAFSLVLGVVLGLLAGFSQTANTFLRPFVLLSRSTPLMSIILLALIWFRSDQVPIFVSFLLSFPIIYGNVVTGLQNVDKGLVEMSHVYRVSWDRTIRELYLPSILPYILAGSSTALGLGLKAVVAAEALSQPRYAIGTRMQVERMYLETAGVFAWTLAALLVSWLLEVAVKRVEQSALRRAGAA